MSTAIKLIIVSGIAAGIIIYREPIIAKIQEAFGDILPVPPDTQPPDNEPPDNEPPVCTNPPLHETIKITVESQPQNDPNTWGFNAVYRNNSCQIQTFMWVRNVFDKNGIAISFRDGYMTLPPGEAGGVVGNHIFDPEERETGKNKIKFNVVRSFDDSTALAKQVTVTI